MALAHDPPPSRGGSRNIEVPGQQGKRDKVGSRVFELLSNRRRPAPTTRAPPPLLPQDKLLKDQLELVRQKQPDGSTRYSIKPLETEFSFDKGFFMFIRAIQLLTQHNKNTIVVRRSRRRRHQLPAAVGPHAAASAASAAPRCCCCRCCRCCCC